MARSRSNASDPFAAALRLLTLRDRSEAELRRKLKQFGFSLSAIDEAVDKCLEYAYLDDSRYAKERARTLMRSGRAVGQKIRQDLYRRGLSEALIHQALEYVESELSAEQILQDQLERRFPDFDYSTADEKHRRRVVSYFQRRGFHLDQIFACIKNPSASQPF